MRKPRFDELTVLPVVVLGALGASLIAAANWVRKVDDSLFDFDDPERWQ